MLPSTSGQEDATSGTPHQDDTPMKGSIWLTRNGRILADREPVDVGSSTYHAGERVNCGVSTSIPDIPAVDGNIFTGSATISISVENMPPMLAARILNLTTSIASILRGGHDLSAFEAGWRAPDTSFRDSPAPR